MKRLILSLFVVLLGATSAMGQMTPEAIIANAPALPTAEEWGAKGEHSDAFKAKMKDLNAKLPRTFQIPTPVGNYAPDRARYKEKRSETHILCSRNQRFNVVNGLISHRTSQN